ncbi:unnamed protein product [Linum tenue]|uniref:Senescence regulator n=2 Tax=Linum tenue TaxID=586396 RepID=A0AAV0JBF2_9ROSI|nr:unnamed protein product [Linum tenue]
MADWYSRRNGDFEEAEVWSFAKQSEPSPASSSNTNRKSSVSSSATRRSTTTAPRAIPAEFPGEGKSTPATAQRSSAPMNIPDWSKIYGANNGGYYVDYQNNDDAHNDDDGDDDVVPPHEWLAKKLARSQISSFSVCEGMGRTLKGRDLSKVRNAILTKTGFLE